MDLDASPQPDEDSGRPFFQRPYFRERIPGDPETARREREERRQRLNREWPNEGWVSAGVQRKRDQFHQMSIDKAYDITELAKDWLDSLPPGADIYGIIPSTVSLIDALNVRSEENNGVDVATTNNDVTGE